MAQRRQNRKNRTDESLLREAVHEYQAALAAGKVPSSAYAVAKSPRYKGKVAKNTLERKFKLVREGKLAQAERLQKARPGQQLVPPDVEDEIVTYLRQMTDSGFKVTVSMLKDRVRLWLDDEEASLAKWWRGFKQRHPDAPVHTKTAATLKRERAAGIGRKRNRKRKRPTTQEALPNVGLYLSAVEAEEKKWHCASSKHKQSGDD